MIEFYETNLDNEFMNITFKSLLFLSLILVGCQDASESSSISSSSMLTSSSLSSEISTSTSLNPMIELNNVLYGNEDRHVLEVAYERGKTESTPAVLFIHGGSWIGGDKSMMRRYRDQIVDAGYVYISMNYRFVTSGATYLDMLDDISLVLQFIKDYAEDLTVDPTQIAFVGESAGAHLALLYSYRNPSVIPISFVMALVPPVNFTDPTYLTFGDPMTQLFLANALMGTNVIDPQEMIAEGYPPSWIDASPITHIDTAIQTLIGYAGMDELIPASNMESFLEEAERVDATVETFFFPNSGHDLANDPIVLNNLLIRFFEYLNLYLY
jgi:acetyl esterase/lipase